MACDIKKKLCRIIFPSAPEHLSRNELFQLRHKCPAGLVCGVSVHNEGKGVCSLVVDLDLQEHKIVWPAGVSEGRMVRQIVQLKVF